VLLLLAAAHAAATALVTPGFIARLQAGATGEFDEVHRALREEHQDGGPDSLGEIKHQAARVLAAPLGPLVGRADPWGVGTPVQEYVVPPLNSLIWGASLYLLLGLAVGAGLVPSDTRLASLYRGDAVDEGVVLRAAKEVTPFARVGEDLKRTEQMPFGTVLLVALAHQMGRAIADMSDIGGRLRGASDPGAVALFDLPLSLVWRPTASAIEDIGWVGAQGYLASLGNSVIVGLVVVALWRVIKGGEGDAAA
jgi:hypothetical protein